MLSLRGGTPFGSQIEQKPSPTAQLMAELCLASEMTGEMTSESSWYFPTAGHPATLGTVP